MAKINTKGGVVKRAFNREEVVYVKPQDRLLYRDIKILVEMKRRGLIRDVDYDIDSPYRWIAIFGAVKLPMQFFNLPDLSVKLPVPLSLYQPTGDGHYSFYDILLVDSRIRTRTRNGWEPIARQFSNMYPEQSRLGWNFLCVIPKKVRKEVDIRAIFPILQKWAMDNGDKGR